MGALSFEVKTNNSSHEGSTPLDPETIRVLANYGFPTLVAVYLVGYVTRSLNGKFDRLTTSVDHLADRFDAWVDRQS